MFHPKELITISTPLIKLLPILQQTEAATVDKVSDTVRPNRYSRVPEILSLPTKQRGGSGVSAGEQGNAVFNSAALTFCGSGVSPRSLCKLNSSAATPVAIGVAKLVPLNRVVPPPGFAPKIFSPGAKMP